jgi:hypothetical protein
MREGGINGFANAPYTRKAGLMIAVEKIRVPRLVALLTGLTSRSRSSSSQQKRRLV